jgi:hypothetical protein
VLIIDKEIAFVIAGVFFVLSFIYGVLGLFILFFLLYDLSK